MKTFIAAAGLALLGAGATLAFGAEADPAARGKAKFDYWCATCHAGDPREGGRFLPGTASLMVKYKGSRPAALEERTDLLPAYIELVIRRGSEGMPFFRRTEISNDEMHDIAAYLARNTKQ